MNFLQSLFLGAVQGLTEFLPVSSSGHLVFFQQIFGVGEEALAFDIAMHVATLIAVVAIFWKELLYMLKKPFSKITLLVVMATIPTAIIGFAFREFFEYAFSSGVFLGACFMITGLVLFYADRSKKLSRCGKDSESMSFMDAIIIGLAQSFAIIPAISRSGLTISAGLFRGLKKEFALKFSFLMSVPAILGPAVIDARNITTQAITSVGIAPLIGGMIAAGVTGYFAIRFMLEFFSRASLRVFSYYLFVLGGLVLADQLFFGIFFEKII
ncbi:MAG: undecaprenyl-diphosphate phosphatase [Candidatus Colwellbacteria bacterium]|jgi:undecaprenyl-diphosphatase|nr:undecaprenyl-diphosphate phosphatase [Candidatus Colwellbacteria bacterium]MCK9497535.1 undecaprenyl-diphosphate phosphatase [Candidatus Colwellbacteria bacterium]MDD3752816.1 undecaprenyl-diphosphate phosphatase [Candidatus Colwellbacteria bacterium]MDD4819111.1 undecaprenyl-diphosphate phosphatase [Candidatus Colwellbacteria bacterium]